MWWNMEYGNKKTRSSLIFRISIGSSIGNEEAQMKSSWDTMQITRMDHPEEGLEPPQHQLLRTQDHLWLFTLNINLNFTTFLNYRNKCLMPQSFVSCPLCFEFGNSNPHPPVHSVVIFGWILLQYSYLIHYQPIGSHLSSIEEENILYIFN